MGIKLYMHDASIDTFCPALFDHWTFPKYFPFDFQRQLPYSYMYEDKQCGPHSGNRWAIENNLTGLTSTQLHKESLS